MALTLVQKVVARVHRAATETVEQARALVRTGGRTAGRVAVPVEIFQKAAPAADQIATADLELAVITRRMAGLQEDRVQGMEARAQALVPILVRHQEGNHLALLALTLEVQVQVAITLAQAQEILVAHRVGQILVALEALGVHLEVHLAATRKAAILVEVQRAVVRHPATMEDRFRTVVHLQVPTVALNRVSTPDQAARSLFPYRL